MSKREDKNKIHALDGTGLDHKSARKMLKHTIIVVQATPNTQPGGVQGALFNFRYHSEDGPSPISQLPNARPPKLISANKRISPRGFT